MSLLDRALAKLTIRAFSDREMTRFAGEIAAMYNPDSVSLSYQNSYVDKRYINNEVQTKDLEKEYSELSLNLVFDARMLGNNTPIAAQLGRLRELCHTVDSASGQLPFLKIFWGNMNWGGYSYYSGRIRSMAFEYTLFDRDGTPLRASVQLTLLGDRSVELQKSELRVQSPPVTVLSIPAMPSLPLIAATSAVAVAGGIGYLDLAWRNALDNLDDLQPGQTLTVSTQEGEG